MYFRSQAASEIKECLFFATGARPTREKVNNSYIITAPGFVVEVKESRRMFVNGEFCRGVEEVKLVVCEQLVPML